LFTQFEPLIVRATTKVSENTRSQELKRMVDVWYQYQGRGSIYVLDNYHPYRREVVRYLDLVGTTYSGNTLFRYCNRYSARRIEIRPFVPTPTDPVNSSELPGSAVDAYLPGAPLRAVDGSVIVGGGTGTGNGSDVTVKYHPANQRQFVANMHTVLPGSGPGETLFHELVHAMRDVHGVRRRTSVSAYSKMENFEEFCAIAAANVYRSERGFKVMRDSHLGYGAEILPEGESYYDFYKSEFTTWFGDQRDFCLALARSTAKFNPFKFAAIDLKLIPAPAASMRL